MAARADPHAPAPAAGQPRRPPGVSPLQGGRSVYSAKRSRGRTAALVAGGLVVIAAVAALAVTPLGGSSSGGKATTTSATTASQRAASHSSHRAHKAARVTPAVNPAETNVAVLNATESEGLAHRTAAQLQQGGYSQATALNGKPPGSGQVSVVEYTSGHRAEAEAVARSVSVTHVLPIEAAVTALAGSANVVVIVGADKAA
jgi:LytR cell envelope-related transcriptional attenuator